MRRLSTVGVIAIILCLTAGPLAKAASDSAPDADKAKKDVTRLEKQFKDAQDRIASLLKDVQSMRDRSVAAEVMAKAQKDRVDRLERQVKALVQEVARLKAGKAAAPAVKPPAQDVEGQVSQVKDGLVRISIGSDAGLAKGHTLVVFRLQPMPKYLGRLRVIEVTAKEAVCQPVGKNVQVQKGDQVASQIKGN